MLQCQQTASLHTNWSLIPHCHCALSGVPTHAKGTARRSRPSNADGSHDDGSRRQYNGPSWRTTRKEEGPRERQVNDR